MRLPFVSKDRYHEHVLVGALNPCKLTLTTFLDEPHLAVRAPARGSSAQGLQRDPVHVRVLERAFSRRARDRNRPRRTSRRGPTHRGRPRRRDLHPHRADQWPRTPFLVAGDVAVHGAERDQGGRPRCAGERAWVGDPS